MAMQPRKRRSSHSSLRKIARKLGIPVKLGEKKFNPASDKPKS